MPVVTRSQSASLKQPPVAPVLPCTSVVTGSCVTNKTKKHRAQSQSKLDEIAVEDKVPWIEYKEERFDIIKDTHFKIYQAYKMGLYSKKEIHSILDEILPVEEFRKLGMPTPYMRQVNDANPLAYDQWWWEM